MNMILKSQNECYKPATYNFTVIAQGKRFTTLMATKVVKRFPWAITVKL